MSEPPSQDPFELLRKMWAPVSLPGMIAPLLNVSEIDKRIADLKSVENWLNMNLNVLRMSIQGLEMQKATLSAFQAMQPRASTATSETAGAAADNAAPPSTGDAWWNLLQQQAQTVAPEPKREKKPK